MNFVNFVNFAFCDLSQKIYCWILQILHLDFLFFLFSSFEYSILNDFQSLVITTLRLIFIEIRSYEADQMYNGNVPYIVDISHCLYLNRTIATILYFYVLFEPTLYLDSEFVSTFTCFCGKWLFRICTFNFLRFYCKVLICLAFLL